MSIYNQTQIHLSLADRLRVLFGKTIHLTTHFKTDPVDVDVIETEQIIKVDTFFSEKPTRLTQPGQGEVETQEVLSHMPLPEGSLNTQKKDTKFLDEKGFVFLDAEKKPYLIRVWSGVPWLFYWHADKRWVSLRRTNQNEIWQASEARLPDEQAELYHELNAKHPY